MTIPLFPIAPLTILQADHVGKVTSEERISWSAHRGEWCRTQLPDSVIDWDSSPIFPFKSCHVWGESSELVLGYVVQVLIVSDSLQSHGLQHTSFPVLHYFLEFAQTHVHGVDDAIQPSHPLSPPFPALDLSQLEDLFHESTLSPDCQLFSFFLSIDTCLSNYWLSLVSSWTWIPWR